MVKRVILLVRLVEESVRKANEEIEREIFEELCDDLPKIPWFEKIEKVAVSESS